jgi:hypothetical protein
MSGMNSDSPGENTNVIVNSMRKQRRSMRVPIIVGTVGLCGLVGIMMLGLGSKREDNYKVDDTKPGPAALETLSADGHSTESAGRVGLVEVMLKSGGQLWIDGKNHGSASKHTLKLEVGPHTLLVKRKSGAPISQLIDVTASKTTQVEFNKNKVHTVQTSAANAP